MTSGSVSWSESGYGYVQSISCTNLNSKVNLGSVAFINNLTTKLDIKGELWIGEVNKIKVDINYKDGTTKTLEIDFDNTIDWGTINSVKAIDITSTTFKLKFDLSLNSEVDYIDRLRVVENKKVVKNFFLKEEHLTMKELIVEMSNNLMRPDTTRTFEVQAMNVNGTIIWSQEITVSSLREITEEEMYQNDMANIAFKAMIDNLLAALGQ